MMLPYTIFLEQDDDWWIASVVEIPGVFTQGRTPEEAKANLADAVCQLLLARAELEKQ